MGTAFGLGPFRLLALLALLVSPAVRGQEPGASVGSTVLFNTDCARCHEGECSGRLSFHLPPEASDQHIRRHGGNLAQSQIRELFELLRHMKEACAFYPLPFALARDGAWGPETLRKLRSPSGQGYFLPLGSLSPGAHRVLLQGLGAGARPSVELIDGGFDFLDALEIEPDAAGWSLRFRTDTAGELFLRVNAPGSTDLTRVELLDESAP
ncbi:MAG: hypothetical protein WAM94_18880 [Chromatiaceae bacterium]